MEKNRTILLVLLALYPMTSYAYVDPNVGGLLFQWLAPVFAVFVMFWGRVKHVTGVLLRRIRELFSRNQ